MKALLLVLSALTVSLHGLPAPATSHLVDAPRRAAPRIIKLHGGALDSRRYLTDWYENLDLMLAMNEPSGKVADLSLAGRRYVEMALYWYGPTWEPFAKDTTLLKTLDPADPRAAAGRLHLPQGALPGIVIYQGASQYRVVSEKGIKILEKYRVPIAP
ncbi:MAG: hypothetical protein ABIZ70_02705 [Gemmatimonadales bacterium]